MHEKYIYNMNWIIENWKSYKLSPTNCPNASLILRIATKHNNWPLIKNFHVKRKFSVVVITTIGRNSLSLTHSLTHCSHCYKSTRNELTQFFILFFIFHFIFFLFSFSAGESYKSFFFSFFILPLFLLLALDFNCLQANRKKKTLQKYFYYSI